MVGGKSAADCAPERRHVAHGGLLGERGAARFQMRRQNRNHVFEQAQLLHQHQRVRRFGLAQRLEGLFDQPRHGGLGQVRAMTLDSGARRGLDFEAELGGEAYRAHHPDGILAHPHLGIADSAD